jgi:NhaP-type Na+/H+ or K+/H+ antiporter
VVPFAAHILAEEVYASGVIAVVVTALEMQRHSRPQDAAERVTRTAFWDVVELLVSGLASGLVGLEVRQVIRDEGAGIFDMIGIAVVVCVLVFAVRFAWLAMMSGLARTRKDSLRQSSAKEVLILTWCGLRGLATLALALALPLTLADGSPFPVRAQLIVIACAVLLATLVPPGLTLPWLMRVLKASGDGSEERDAARVLAGLGQQAAIAALKNNELMKQLPPEKVALVKEKMTGSHAQLLDGSLRNESVGRSASAGANSRSPCRPLRSTRPAKKSWRRATSRTWTLKWRTGCSASSTCAP